MFWTLVRGLRFLPSYSLCVPSAAWLDLVSNIINISWLWASCRQYLDAFCAIFRQEAVRNDFRKSLEVRTRGETLQNSGRHLRCSVILIWISVLKGWESPTKSCSNWCTNQKGEMWMRNVILLLLVKAKIPIPKKSRLDNTCTSGKVGEKWETLKGSGFSVSDFGQWGVKLSNFSAKLCENTGERLLQLVLMTWVVWVSQNWGFSVNCYLADGYLEFHR